MAEREFKTVHVPRHLKPLQWYKTERGEPGRYVMWTGFQFMGPQSIMLLANKYVSSTIEGQMIMRARVTSYIRDNVSEVTPEEYKEVKKAIKYSGSEELPQVIKYIFVGHEE